MWMWWGREFAELGWRAAVRLARGRGGQGWRHSDAGGRMVMGDAASTAARIRGRALGFGARMAPVEARR